jgi:hypothetical protein
MAINNPRAGSGAALTTAIYPVFPGLFQHTLHADNITGKERSMFRISGRLLGVKALAAVHRTVYQNVPP